MCEDKHFLRRLCKVVGFVRSGAANTYSSSKIGLYEDVTLSGTASSGPDRKSLQAEALLGRVYLFYSGFYNDEVVTLPDGTDLTKAEVGGYITEARRSGNVWYVATVTKEARKGMSLPLKFLGEGDYEAVIYRDTTKRMLKIDKKTVTRYDILSYDLLAESGYVVKLTKKEL